MSVLAVSSLESFLQLIGVLLIFVFVLLITYLTTKWMGGFQKAHSNNKNLKIIETIHVGNNKIVEIVQAGTKYLVIAVGKDEVHLLTELSEAELTEIPVLDNSTMLSSDSFQDIFNKVKEKFPKKQG
ncbi:MAG: flagellar biosynthetic protein FliO [Agathobacter sp.]